MKSNFNVVAFVHCGYDATAVAGSEEFKYATIQSAVTNGCRAAVCTGWTPGNEFNQHVRRDF